MTTTSSKNDNTVSDNDAQEQRNAVGGSVAAPTITEGSAVGGIDVTTTNTTTTINATTTTTKNIVDYNYPTLYDQIEKCLAQSFLIFLLSDLRLLSATGRIATNYSQLFIDSDTIERTNAEAMACISKSASGNDEDQQNKVPRVFCISPAHVMTILLLEMINEVERSNENCEEEDEENKKKKKGESSSNDDVRNSILVDEDDDDNIFFGDNSGGKQCKTRKDQVKQKRKMAIQRAANSQSAGIRGYTLMIANDLNDDIPRFKNIKNNKSSCDDNAKRLSLTESTAAKKKKNRRQQQRRNDDDDDDDKDLLSSSMVANDGSVRSDLVVNDDEEEVPVRMSSIDEDLPSNPSGEIHDDDNNKNIQTCHSETTNKQYHNRRKSNNNKEGRRRLSMPNIGPGTMIKREDMLLVTQGASQNILQIATDNPIINEMIEEHRKKKGRRPSVLDNKQLTDIMKEMLNNRSNNDRDNNDNNDNDDDSGLSNIKEFFKVGSLSHVMAQSTANIVWIQDWYPSKECTYAICVDKKEKRILVVFRGAITMTDWEHAFDSSSKKVINPIKDTYDNKFKYIQLHRGFYRYLFRRRKDTGTTKYDEITNKAHTYGINEIGNEYRLEVTGHSLGAGLSTVFTFFASTDIRFTCNAPIHCITFGGPLVCGYEMMHSFRYQERNNKIRYCRVHNARDAVTHSPNMIFNFNKYGAPVYHVGCDLRLPLIRKYCYKYCFGDPIKGQLSYVPLEGWWNSYLRQIKNGYLWNMPIRVWKQALFHSLIEHQARLLLINEDNTPWFNENLDEIYNKRFHNKVNFINTSIEIRRKKEIEKKKKKKTEEEEIAVGISTTAEPM